TNVQQESRKQLVRLAREHDVLPIAIVLDMPEAVCAERNAGRADRAGLPRHVIQRHQRELRRSLRGLEREGFRKVHILRGVEEDDAFKERVRAFIDGLVSHYVLDDGRLVVCHAGLPEKYHGRTSGRVRSHALYGDTTGETDEFGLPVRYPWAEEYRGRAAVVYGHTPIARAGWLNN